MKLGGDTITDSFVVVTIKHYQLDSKILSLEKSFKPGNRGEIDYQLLTNSKAEIWFKQVNCKSFCDQIVY